MQEIPDSDERERLLDGCARLVAQVGAEPFLAAPFVVGTREFFPAVPATVGGLRALLRRFLVYAGLEHLQPTLHVYDRGDETHHALRRGRAYEPHKDVAAYFSGIEADTAYFGFNIAYWSDQDALLGVLAHEVAHAFRWQKDVIAKDDKTEEELTDLTAVLLGFGPLIVNASFRHRSGGEQIGAYTTHRVQVSRGGYLPPESVAFVLGAFMQLRLERGDIDHVLNELDRDRAASVRACMKKLPAREALAARLGLPPAAEWPPVRRCDPDDLAAVDDQDDDEERLDGAPRDITTAQLAEATYRVPAQRGVAGVFTGALIGCLFGLAFGYLTRSSVVAVGTLLVGAVLVPNLGLVCCADPECEKILWGRRTHCPGCGRVIRGDLASRAEWLDADRGVPVERKPTTRRARRTRARRNQR